MSLFAQGQYSHVLDTACILQLFHCRVRFLHIILHTKQVHYEITLIADLVNQFMNKKKELKYFQY